MKLTAADVERLCTSGTLAEVREAYAGVSQAFQEISTQLAQDKADMMEERADLLAKGVHPREAQMRASSGGDHSWRGAAIAAQKTKQAQLTKLKQRLKILNAQENSASRVDAHGVRLIVANAILVERERMRDAIARAKASVDGPAHAALDAIERELTPE